MSKRNDYLNDYLMEEQVSSRRHEWRIALTASAPVMLGYIVLGLGYGLYTHNLGFSWWVPTLMALTIYGGSVEFVIANMLTQAFNPLTVLVITLVVGFRQFFYSIAMLGKYKGHGFQKFFQIFSLTDETFVVNYQLRLGSYSKAPLVIKAVTVRKDRSRKESSFSRAQTCPNKTSSFNSANFGANSPSWSRPAVCFLAI